MEIAKSQYAGKRQWTTRDYVQDGLLTVFDGIENVRAGTHDPSALYWTNLVTGQQVPVISGRFGSSFYSRESSDGNLILSPAAEVGRMWEMVFTFEGGKAVLTNDSFGYMLEIDNGRFWRYVRTDGGSGSGFDTKLEYNENRIHFISGSLMNYCYKYWQNGKFASKIDGYPQYYTTSYRYNVGARSSFKDESSNMRIYCFRVYGRELSDDEIASNHEVDKKRFGADEGRGI